MSKDDYHVIVYQVLSYLYACLKAVHLVTQAPLWRGFFMPRNRSVTPAAPLGHRRHRPGRRRVAARTPVRYDVRAVEERACPEGAGNCLTSKQSNAIDAANLDLDKDFSEVRLQKRSTLRLCRRLTPATQAAMSGR